MKNEPRNVCLFVTEKKKERETEGVHLRRESEDLSAPHALVSACRRLLCVEVWISSWKEGGSFSLHPCCLIGGLLSSLDGLMEAALLRLVGGLIHHSPVQVRCRHLPSSNLILLLHHLLLPTPPTYRQKCSCALPTFSGDNILFLQGEMLAG